MTFLLWLYAKLSAVVDYLTYDLVRERSWVKDVPPALRSGGPSAENQERPHPWPVKKPENVVTPSKPEPLYFASPAEELGFRIACKRQAIRERDRAEWQRKVDEDIEELLGSVREGDPR